MNKTLKSLLRACLPRSVHPQRILAGPLRGQRIVTSWHDYPAAITGRTERPLLNWFAANVKPGETWLDIGAHYGYTAIALSRLVQATGRVFAFEPMLSTAGYLMQTRLLNNLPQLTVVPMALAAPDKLVLQRLPATRGMVDSTLGRQTADAGTKSADGDQADWQETILVARLDWLRPQVCNGQTEIDGVKVDVQGMEIDVLRGMAETLRCCQPQLVVEVHRGVNRVDLLTLVERLGYSSRAIPIEPVGGESDPRFVDDRSYAFQIK